MSTPLILIVEDETALRYIYQRVLKGMGYEVLMAAHGQEAIDLLDVHTPALIFLDMLLPYVGGEKVVAYIARQPRLHQTHVVIASSSSQFASYAAKLPSAEFQIKPVLPGQIREIAQRYARLTTE